MTGVYKITNKINDNYYIGSSINVMSRWYNHRRCAKMGSKKSPHLYAAMRKYGIDNFVLTPLIICEIDDLRYYEQKLLDLHYGNKAGYNCSASADAPWRGKTMSMETKQKLSKSLKGRPAWNRGIPRTDLEKSHIKAATFLKTPPKMTDVQKMKCVQLYFDNLYTIKNLAKVFNVSTTTIIRTLRTDVRYELTERRGGKR